MKYNKEKIKKFNEYTIEDYKRSLEVEEIAKVDLVKRTDNSFTQIGIRPVLDDDIFIDPSFSEYLPSAGRLVAVGEMDFLIKEILENKDTKKIEINESIDFPNFVEFNKPLIIISNKFTVEVFSKLMHRIDYEERHPRLDRKHRIITIPESVLDNKIIILDTNAILWEKEVFYNDYTRKDETLDINIKPAEEFGKVDITIRSVNKIKRLDPSLIKILEVKDGNN